VPTAQRTPQPGLGGPYFQHPDPLRLLIDAVMLPVDFVAYPARRDGEVARYRDW